MTRLLVAIAAAGALAVSGCGGGSSGEDSGTAPSGASVSTTATAESHDASPEEFEACIKTWNREHRGTGTMKTYQIPGAAQILDFDERGIPTGTRESGVAIDVVAQPEPGQAPWRQGGTQRVWFAASSADVQRELEAEAPTPSMNIQSGWRRVQFKDGTDTATPPKTISSDGTIALIASTPEGMVAPPYEGFGAEQAIGLWACTMTFDSGGSSASSSPPTSDSDQSDASTMGVASETTCDAEEINQRSSSGDWEAIGTVRVSGDSLTCALAAEILDTAYMIPVGEYEKEHGSEVAMYGKTWRCYPTLNSRGDVSCEGEDGSVIKAQVMSR